MKPPADTGALAFPDATIEELSVAMARGELSARSLAEACLARIGALDDAGPAIHAMVELNPDALDVARARDLERAAGRVRGPLHGIPLVLKDNVATADRMQTTAGSLALVGARAPRDAFLVQRLRDAGAVILGKTNLSEWANARSPRSVSGWSARGGLTRNPHALDRSASGSSSGSAAAVAVGMAAAAIGTETDGSIVSPASACGVVGFKPTVGRVSRDGIVPISRSQDTPGPVARTVADAAIVFAAIEGADARDPATHGASPFGWTATRAPAAGALAGTRVAALANPVGRHPDVAKLFASQLEVLRAAGAEVVSGVGLPSAEQLLGPEVEVLMTELKAGLAEYLAEFGTGAPVATLADVIAFNEANAASEMPYFEQELFALAETTQGLETDSYRRALAECRRLARAEGLDRAFAATRAQVLVAPTSGPAWLTDLVNGDSFTGSISSPAAVAGYPHLTVPMGFVGGLPVGLSIMGPAWADLDVLRVGLVYEEGSRARRAPAFARTVP